MKTCEECNGYGHDIATNGRVLDRCRACKGTGNEPTPPAHSPLVQGPGVIDCVCGGYTQAGVYSEDFGARNAFLDHVVSELGDENDWPETWSVEGDRTYIGDAT